MTRIKNLKIKKDGFTVIEMLIAMLVLISVIGGIVGIYIVAIRQQASILLYQSVLDQVSYNFEFMSRNLRLAIKDMSGSCIPAGSNYEVTRGGSGIKFINHLQADDCQEFFLENGQMKYWKQSTMENLPLTSINAKIQVISMKFDVVGEYPPPADNLQPLVSVSSEIKSTAWPGQSQTIKIQTSVSQRNLDVEY